MPQDLQNFNTQDANVTLWIFKKSIDAKTKGAVFTGRWVETAPELDQQLLSIFNSHREAITETKEYSLVALTNENSALTIGVDQTLAGLIIDRCDSETDASKATDLKQLENAAFYVIKIRVGDAVAYAVRRTESSWKSKNARNIITGIWVDAELKLVDDNSFRIEKLVDFIIINGNIYIRNKKNFEIVLNFKEAHKKEFENILKDKSFNGVFTDAQIINDYVGNNKTHLRRALTIHTLGYYKDKDFMDSLFQNMGKLKYTFAMDANCVISPTIETCPEIFKALLDHRLISHTDDVFEVEDASRI